MRTLGFLDDSYRNIDDGFSQRGMAVFLAESREQSSKDGMTYGSLIDYESQKIFRKCALHNRGRIVFSMKCFRFMSVSPWIMYGYWVFRWLGPVPTHD